MSQPAKPLKTLERELDELIQERTRVYRTVQDFKVDAETTRKAESQLGFLSKQITDLQKKIKSITAPSNAELAQRKTAWENS